MSNENVSIYPSPVANEIIIGFADFEHSKIEIFDAIGKMVNRKLTAEEVVLYLPVHLSDGMCFVKICN